MQRDFSVVIHQNDSRRSFLQQGFLFCVVTGISNPHKSRRFVYCLHCSKLKSVAWFYRHKKSVGFVPSQDDVDFYKTHLFHFQQDIGTELDLLYDYGKLFVRHIEEHPHFSANVQNSFGTVGGR